MKPTIRAVPIALAALAVLVLAATPAAAAKAEVTITNLTYGQIISPPVVVSHDKTFQLFAPGQPASAGLSALAEDALTGVLTDELAAHPGVFDFEVAAGGIPPGATRTVEIEINGTHRWISLAGMLVTTNDAFAAVRGLRTERRPNMTYAEAWDAGSVENNEDCDFIPGPPCGNAGVRTAMSEGFVHIHRGIHGIDDLVAADVDWRNPVAAVSVRLIPETGMIPEPLGAPLGAE
ncbi:MAG: spondin domain-containing protein [Thermoanaerobaculia bacterium]|nr:spondin domain-containing protein [Thermoanaerobaculia bacterium]